MVSDSPVGWEVCVLNSPRLLYCSRNSEQRVCLKMCCFACSSVRIFFCVRSQTLISVAAETEVSSSRAVEAGGEIQRTIAGPVISTLLEGSISFAVELHSQEWLFTALSYTRLSSESVSLTSKVSNRFSWVSCVTSGHATESQLNEAL